MDSSTDMLKGKWKEIKGELQKGWGKITDDEWEQTKGDAKSITGLIQQKYGAQKEDLSHKIGGIFQKYISEPTKNALRDDKPSSKN